MARPDRFWDKIETEPNSGCWIWIGARLPRGYGQFSDKGVVVRAGRWAYEHLIGHIPRDLVLDHKCRNLPCVNPTHLEPVTQRVNVLRGFAPAAIQARQTHCIRGHPLAGTNLYVNPDGRRQCKTCRRVIDRRRRGKAE